MTEDRLIEELAKVAGEEEARQRRLLDERWDALAADALSDTDRHELEARAAESREGAAAWEAFRPLGADYRRQLAAQLTDAVGGDEPAVAENPVQVDRPERGEVVPIDRSPRWRWAKWAIPAAAIAAGLVLVLRPMGEVAPLPTYEIALAGTVAEQRSVTASDPEGIQLLAAGNRFELNLTPTTDVEGAVGAEIRLLRDGELQALSWSPEVATSGTVRWRGTVGEDIDLPPGRSSLVIVVGRSGKLPGDKELLAAVSAAGRAAGDGWRAWWVEILVH